jgi:hypothetical protein
MKEIKLPPQQTGIVPDTFRVFSFDRMQTGIPAGEYRSLNRAIEHANTVTYPMIVLNWRNHIVFQNWED